MGDDWVNDMGRTPPQTENAVERGFADEVRDEELGKNIADEDEDGDIADEGPGHRG